jgi:ABC-2 type transport system permease protein
MKLSIFSNMLRFMRLHCLYLRISLKLLSVYRMSAFLTVLFSLVFLIAEILTVNVYYTFSDRIGDWDRGSFYILLGTFNIITCFYNYLFEIPHDDFALKIRYGDLDGDLIKPMDALAFTTIQKVDYASLFNLPIPIWLVYHGIHELDLKVTSMDILLYLVTGVIGIFIVYLINQFFVNFSFWIIEASNATTASDQVVQLGSRPLQVYPRLIQFGFSYVVPIILCTNLSVQALQHNLRFTNLMILLIATTLFFVIVRIQWKLGLRRYASASS